MTSTQAGANDRGDLHVVLGAGGGVGSAVARELVARGRRTRGVTRSGKADVPDVVEMVAGNVSTLEDARRVCAGASVVYMCANPPYDRWREDFPPMLAGALAGAESAGAKLVMADNLYVYAPTSKPLAEDMPWAPITHKGAVRKAMDETLMAAHASGEVRVALGRASDYYGPRGMNSSNGARFFEKLLAGKAVESLGPLGEFHALTFLGDFARGLVTLGERDEALGQSWHIPAAAALTARQFDTLAAEVAGVPPKMTTISPLMLRAIGLFSPRSTRWSRCATSSPRRTSSTAQSSLAPSTSPRHRIAKPSAKPSPGSAPKQRPRSTNEAGPGGLDIHTPEVGFALTSCARSDCAGCTLVPSQSVAPSRPCDHSGSAFAHLFHGRTERRLSLVLWVGKAAQSLDRARSGSYCSRKCHLLRQWSSLPANK